METKLEEKTVREVFDGYIDNAENGVVAYGGKLKFHTEIPLSPAGGSV